MSDKLNLKQKLVEIRKSVEYLQKTETGNQGAKYVDPAIILKKIRTGMDEYGVLLYPEISEPIIDMIPQPTAKNPENKGYLSKNIMSYVWSDADTGDEIKVPWFSTGKHMQDPAMAFGGGLTYSERYFLLKFFQIPTSKDDPEFFSHKAKQTESVVELEKQLHRLMMQYKLSPNEQISLGEYYNNAKNIKKRTAADIDNFLQCIDDVLKAYNQNHEDKIGPKELHK